jgi:signal transduction histidine kinase
MGSRALGSVAVRLLLLFLAGAAAQAAWRAGYWASLALCGLAGVWLAAGLLRRASDRRGPGDGAEDGRRSAVLEREREARALAAYLDHAPAPLLAAAPDGRLAALNLAARRLFGADDLVADPPAALAAAAAEAAPGERQTLTLDLEGAPRAYALTVSELASDGRSVRILALVDVQAEIQAAEASALRELIQVLSHEIMNSLTPVTSLAQTAAELLADPGGAAQAREAVESVARRSEGLLRFIGAYRELARLPEPRFADVSLRALLDEVALLFRSRWEARGVRLDYEPPPDAAVSLDRDLIAQALLNVLANAAEAAVESAAEPRVRLRAGRTRQGRLTVAVEDNGQGIGLADPNQIFRPFFTTKAGGTGVGLSLARQVALAHGGEIAVANSPGGGAAVTLSL